MTPKEAAEIIHTLRIYHKQCGGCYVKGEEEALKIAEMLLNYFATLDKELSE